MAPRLSAETIGFIEAASAESTAKPDFKAIAQTFSTTVKSVQYIHAKRGHIKLYPDLNWKSKPGRRSKITLEIEKGV